MDALLEERPLVGNLGIGHTRWATHGVPSEVNSHPHFDMQKEIAVVHNGIIENYQELRVQLGSEGVTFRSQTDTEPLLIWYASIIRAICSKRCSVRSRMWKALMPLALSAKTIPT